jgi:hypothetical protein
MLKQGTCKMRNEIETKRNEINRNETKFTETKRNQNVSVNFVSISFRFGEFRFDLFRFVSISFRILQVPLYFLLLCKCPVVSGSAFQLNLLTELKS